MIFSDGINDIITLLPFFDQLGYQVRQVCCISPSIITTQSALTISSPQRYDGFVLQFVACILRLLPARLAAVAMSASSRLSCGRRNRGRWRRPGGTERRRADRAVRGQSGRRAPPAASAGAPADWGWPAAPEERDRSSSQENSSSRGPLTCIGGFSKRRRTARGDHDTPRRSVSLPSVAETEGARPHDAGGQTVWSRTRSYPGRIAHEGDYRYQVRPGAGVSAASGGDQGARMPWWW